MKINVLPSLVLTSAGIFILLGSIASRFGASFQDGASIGFVGGMTFLSFFMALRTVLYEVVVNSASNRGA